MSWRDKKDKEDKEKDIFPFDDIFKRPFFGNDIFKKLMEEIAKLEENFENDPKVQVKKYGPYVWGYSMTIGPDGKPEVKQFGNVNPDMNQPALSDGSKEPLVDIFVEDKTVKIIVEMPGVNKEDIQVNATSSKISIKANTNERQYNTERDLEVKIKPLTSKSSYNNGILELIFDREEPLDEPEFEVEIV
jgi:HSP20 family protein